MEESMPHYSQIPEKPKVVTGMKTNPNDFSGAKSAKGVDNRVYFFKRWDGKILFAKGEAAWTMYSKAPQVVGYEPRRHTFLGSSDGELYKKALEEAKEIFKKEGSQKAQERLKKGEEEELEAARGQMIPPPNTDGKNFAHQTVNLNGELI